MSAPDPKPVAAPDPDPAAPRAGGREAGRADASDTQLHAELRRQIELEAAILDELRRMNRLLVGLTRGPRRFTLAFFSGITRGLGAVLGATVVLSLLLGLLSMLDTTPIIGRYVQSILSFVSQNGGVGAPLFQHAPMPTATATATAEPGPVDTPAPVPDEATGEAADDAGSAVSGEAPEAAVDAEPRDARDEPPSP